MDADQVARRLSRKVQELSALLDFTRALSGLLAAEEVVRRLVLTLAGQWALRTYGLAVFREGRPPVVRQRGLPLLEPAVTPFATPGHPALAGWTAPFTLSGAADGSSRAPDSALLAVLREGGVLAVIPLLSGETVSGFAALGPRPSDLGYDEDDLAHAFGLVSQAVVALEGAFQHEEAAQWRRTSQARDEFRRLDATTGIVFAAVSRVGAAGLPSEEELISLLLALLPDAGITVERARLKAALDGLVERGAFSRETGGSLRLLKEDWLLLPEVRRPLAEMVREARRRVGAYELVARLGAGGMGEVWRARNVHDGSEAAVKLLLESDGEEPALRERFEREGEIVSDISHPNVVRLLARGEHEGRLYLAMELVDGETVQGALRSGPFAPEESIRALREVGAALSALHRRDVVHRDVKASNVMRTRAGRYVLLDLGLARGLTGTTLTRPGEMVGTIAYMAPELLRGQGATAAADVWSLGVLFVEMLTGRRPWVAGDSVGLTVEVLTTGPRVPDDLPGGEPSRRLAAGMLAPERRRRLADGDAVLHALDQLVRERPSPSGVGWRAPEAEIPGPPDSPRTTRLRAPVLAPAAGAAGTSTGGTRPGDEDPTAVLGSDVTPVPEEPDGGNRP